MMTGTGNFIEIKSGGSIVMETGGFVWVGSGGSKKKRSESILSIRRKRLCEEEMES